MDIKHMRHAIALAEELSFARAAERLHLSQPALSRSLQMLEQELGLPLFDRDNRNVALTTAGAQFMEQARRLVYQARSLERDMALLRNGDIGQVAFGCGPMPTAAFLPALLSSVRAARPGLQLKVASNNWRQLLLHLRSEDIEFFIADTRELAPDTGLDVMPLCRQYGAFLCRAGHPLLTHAARGLRHGDALRYGFASLTMPAAVLAGLGRLCGLAPHEHLPVALECDNVRVLADLTRNSDVILLACEAGVAQEIRDGTLVALEFDEPPATYAEIGVVQLYGRTLSPGAVLLLDHLKAVAAVAPATVMYPAASMA